MLVEYDTQIWPAFSYPELDGLDPVLEEDVRHPDFLELVEGYDQGALLYLNEGSITGAVATTAEDVALHHLPDSDELGEDWDVEYHMLEIDGSHYRAVQARNDELGDKKSEEFASDINEAIVEAFEFQCQSCDLRME